MLLRARGLLATRPYISAHILQASVRQPARLLSAPFSSAAASAAASASAASHSSVKPFKLEHDLSKLTPPHFGFNGLGELVFIRTYARRKPDGALERWEETVERVVNGTFTLQKRHMHSRGQTWDEALAQHDAKDMFDRMFTMKFLPPGRGLWAMGSSLTEERRLFAALNNCAFVSTDKLREDITEPFTFLMDAAMLGVGVGFDTRGAKQLLVVKPDPGKHDVLTICDSREGWVDSLRALLASYLHPTSQAPRAKVKFDYGNIRKAGSPIKGFGGVSSGPEPLRGMHKSLVEVLDELADAEGVLSSRGIVDIMNLIGRCVVSGNVRRTAEIAFGEPEDADYVGLKDYAKNPKREAYGWTSNNSVFAKVGMDYTSVCDSVVKNGEPGFMWLDNAKRYGRMHPADGPFSASDPDKDPRAMGGNPCLEQTLESYELCCLVETFPAVHASFEDYEQTLRTAFLYAKTVTLESTHWERSNVVMQRNRRIGCSMSGIAQFLSKHHAAGDDGARVLREWCDKGYARVQQVDEELSARFGIPRSIKTTCVKPSGTVSLLAGATPGIHYPEARRYIRRVRLASNSELVPALAEAGYDVEPSVTDPDNTHVVSVPIDAGPEIATTKDRSLRDQMELAALMQKHWADNQVSCTVTFDPDHEAPLLVPILREFDSQLKGISFLPRLKHGAFAQMPYEAIDQATYEAMYSKLKPLDLSAVYTPKPVAEVAKKGGGPRKHIGVELPSSPDSFCDADSCERL